MTLEEEFNEYRSRTELRIKELREEVERLRPLVARDRAKLDLALENQRLRRMLNQAT